MGKLSVVVSCLILICAGSVAMAMPATTLQTWTFDDADNPALPECYDNQYGDPVAKLSTSGDPNYFGWLNVVNGRQGVWTGEPLKIELVIPNNPAPNAYKEVWLEMDFMQNLDWIQLIPSDPNGSYVTEISRLVSSPDTNGWKTLNIGWIIEPNPSEEKICMGLSGTGGFVDSITVETACVPEPATLALLSLGSLVLVKIRKK